MEQPLADLVTYLRSDEGRRFVRADRGALRHEIARRYTEIRIAYNLARYTVSVSAKGGVPGYEVSVNQLFGAELLQRLARTGASAFGPFAPLWQRLAPPRRAACPHPR